MPKENKFWSFVKLVAITREAQLDYYKNSKAGAPKDIKRKKLAKALELEARLDVEMERIWKDFPDQKPQTAENPVAQQTSIDQWLAQ